MLAQYQRVSFDRIEKKRKKKEKKHGQLSNIIRMQLQNRFYDCYFANRKLSWTIATHKYFPITHAIGWQNNPCSSLFIFDTYFIHFFQCFIVLILLIYLDISNLITFFFNSLEYLKVIQILLRYRIYLLNEFWFIIIKVNKFLIESCRINYDW